MAAPATERALAPIGRLGQRAGISLTGRLPLYGSRVLQLRSVAALITAAAATCALLVATAAGASGTSNPRVVEFSQLPHGWIEGIPRDVRPNSRIVGVFAGHRLAVAPTRNGNFCKAFSGGFAGCRVRAANTINPTLLGTSQGLEAIAGDIVAEARGALFVTFGSRQYPIAVTWVSRPIAAGFFFITVPKGQTAARLILRSGSHIVTRTDTLRIQVPRKHP